MECWLEGKEWLSSSSHRFLGLTFCLWPFACVCSRVFLVFAARSKISVVFLKKRQLVVVCSAPGAREESRKTTGKRVLSLPPSRDSND
jgi:hypothetical protein